MGVRALALTAAVLLASPAAGATAPPSKLESRVDAYLEPYQTLEIFQGAVLIAHGGQPLLEKGYGYANVELGVRNTPAMSFRVASLTRVFTEVLLGCLAEQGKLSLDAPLPEGDSLARVIEKVTGEPYSTALATLVLDPLGLANTAEEADSMRVRNRASGYTTSARSRHGLEVAPLERMATMSGGGSLVSTVGDLHRLLRAMYTDRPIKAATWRKLFPPDSVFSYHGRGPGHNAYIGRDFVHDIDVVVLCNNYSAGMVSDVGADLMAMANGRAVTKPHWRADVRTDSLRTAPLVGRYRAAPGALPYGAGPFAIRRYAGDLVLELDDRPVDTLIPQGDDTYLLRNLWSEMRFVPAPEGQPPTVSLRPLWFTTEPKPLERMP